MSDRSLREVLVRIEKFIDAVAPSKLTKELDSIRREVTHALGEPPSAEELAQQKATADLIDHAHDLISNIENNGLHDNWKGLAKALRKYQEAQ